MKLAGLGSRVTFLGCQVMNQGTAAWYLSVPGSGDGWSHSVNIRGGLAYFTRGGWVHGVVLEELGWIFYVP